MNSMGTLAISKAHQSFSAYTHIIVTVVHEEKQRGAFHDRIAFDPASLHSSVILVRQ